MHDTVPWAKWMEFAPPPVGAPATVSADAWLCASPMTAAQILSRGLWKNVSAAVCTSATLTACGRFDFFDRLSGLNRFPERRAMVVASPVDYSRQGELRIAPMVNSPKSPEFSSELCRVLPALLREHGHGQLVLFTSRRQMGACHAALPRDLSEQVQMQGESSRTEMLAEHGRRVARGKRSILFGLQSFGEGIDLPGSLCEHVVIDKLPFAPPNSPVEEALSEWLTGQGRDPFVEISVPRAAMKLAQSAGPGADWLARPLRRRARRHGGLRRVLEARVARSRRHFEQVLANAAHVKNVPGRKTDRPTSTTRRGWRTCRRRPDPRPLRATRCRAGSALAHAYPQAVRARARPADRATRALAIVLSFVLHSILGWFPLFGQLSGAP